ncbi:MAG: hypothetical protein RL748_1262, partial [Pseudomonadota bacterium]
MNHIYRLIWSKRLGSLVVVSETATGCGKDAAGCDGVAGASAGISRRWRAFLRPLVLALLSAQVLAGPQNGVVVAGKGSIATSANTTTISQTTPNLTLNWNSFNIGAGERVVFQQPSSSAIALNRVLGIDGSQILGQLQANGQVFLINPNGILFGRHAQVNVGGLVASTLNISDADFAARRFRFAGNVGTGVGAGKIENQGQLTAGSGGYISLLGQQVSNDGIISAQLGKVALAGGQAVTLDIVGDGLISAVVDQAAVNALVSNQGMIHADGGQVLLSAKSASALLDTVVNNSGVVVANTLSGHGGEIRLDGGAQGVVSVSGSLLARGEQEGERGGEVRVLGDKVGLFEHARVDASGQNGGGIVLVGGNYQGHGPEANASFTHVADQVSIKADAISQGDGGKVILWADKQTNFLGQISAKGGVLGGNGGFVETSGKQILHALGQVDASAAKGKGGTWLLDPNDITIDDNFDDHIIEFITLDDHATLNASSLSNALTNGTTVRVQTGNGGANTERGNISVNTAVDAVGTGATLNLDAQGDIVFASTSSITGTNLALNLNAGTNVSNTNPGTNASTIIMANGFSITTKGGNIAATTKGAIQLAGIDTGAGNLTVTSNGGAITQVSALTVGGTTTLNANSGSVNLSTANNAITTLGAVTATGGDFTLNNTGSSNTLILAGNVNVGINLIDLNSGNQQLNFGTNSVTAAGLHVKSSSPVLGNANLTAVTGTIQLEPFDTTAAISLADGTGTFQVDTTTIGKLKASNASTIEIGVSGGTGTLTTGGAVDLAGKNLTLHAGTYAESSASGNIIEAANLVLNANGGANIGASGTGSIDIAVNKVSATTTNGGSVYLASGSGFDLGTTNLGVGSLNLAILSSGRALTQSGPITAGSLAVLHVAGSTDFSTQDNQIGDLGAITGVGQIFSLKNTVPLTQSGVMSIDTFALTNTGGVSNLAQANNVLKLGPVTNTAGDFTFINTGSSNTLTLTGDIDVSGAHDITIDAGKNQLALGSANLIANKVSLSSNGVSGGTFQGDVILAPNAADA